MSEKAPHRRPATFKLGDPGVIVMDPDDAGRPARGTVQITPEADPAQLPVPIDVPLMPARRGFRPGAATTGRRHRDGKRHRHHDRRTCDAL